MASDHHHLSYRILNKLGNWPDLQRDLSVHASPAELDQLDREGYLVREKLLDSTLLEKCRERLDRIEALESSEAKLQAEGKGGTSWGVFVRYLLHKDPSFMDLAQFEPILSVAKAMMGPLVRLRGLSARISYPKGDVVHETPMHTHLRHISTPLPRWFSQPHALEALIYLDDLNEERGTVALVPGSHKWLDLEVGDKNDYEEIELSCPAGSAVLMHANTWHQAKPTISKKRRMIILSYTPTWLRKSPYGEQPDDELTKDFLSNATREQKELLGLEGYT